MNNSRQQLVISRPNYNHFKTIVGPIFGYAGRRAVRAYLVTTCGVMILLLAVAWSIDLASNLGQVLQAGDQTLFAQIERLALYLGLRSVDIVTRLLVVATFVGVLIAEIFRLRQRELIILRAAGWTPLQTLCAACLFGLVIGGVQFSLENWLRPAAVFLQVDHQLGSYGRRFARGETKDAHWFFVGNDIVRARIDIGDNPKLLDLELYRGLATGGVRDIILAKSAQPGPHANVWRFQGVSWWTREWGDLRIQKGPQGITGPSRMRFLGTQTSQDIPLSLNPVSLTYFDIPGVYLPQKALKTLVLSEPVIVPKHDYQTALTRRSAAAWMPIVIAMLAASVAQFASMGRVQAVHGFVFMGFAGYFAHISNKTNASLGEIGIISPGTAAWSTVIFVIITIIALQLFQPLLQWLHNGPLAQALNRWKPA